MSFLFSYISVDFGFSLKIRNRHYVYQNFIWYLKTVKGYKPILYEETDDLFPDFILGCGFVIIQNYAMSDSVTFVYLSEGSLKTICAEYLNHSIQEINEILPSFQNEYRLPMPEKVVIEPIKRRNRVFGTFFLLSSFISLITAIINGSQNIKSSVITFVSSLFLVISFIFVIPFIVNCIKRQKLRYDKKHYNENCNKILLKNEFDRRKRFRIYSIKQNTYAESLFQNCLLSFLTGKEMTDIPNSCEEFIPNLEEEYAKFTSEMKLLYLTKRNVLQEYLFAMLLRTKVKEQHASICDTLSVMKNDNLLSIPIGKDDNAEMHYLNLADGYDGPHMLLCGTTGSGKSEFIISYLLFLFSVYSPKELNVCIIDFKGGATAAVFRDFPHIVGISTDLDEIGLKRCMSAIRSEVKKREEAFKRVSEEHLIPSVNLKLYRSLYLKGKVSTPMPELFIVIDEFAELRNLYPKYLEELIMISRIGRSLGIHLILICQQVTGSVDRNILLNTSVRIAFRLLSESESYEVTTEKEAYKLSKAGQFIIRLENTKETLKLQGFYSKMPYPNENRILDTNENVIQTKDFDNGKDLFSVLAEEITQKQYEKAVLLWNDHYVFPTKDIIIAIESISDSEYLLLTKEILIGKTMILETDNPTAKENLKKCLFYGLHTKAYQLSEEKEAGYGTFVDIGSEYEMYVLFTKLIHIEECTLLFVDSLDIFSECHYKLLDMFLNILSGKNRNVIVCMFKRPKSSLLGNILRNTDFIFGYEEKTKKYINDTSQIFLNDYFLKDTIASEAAKIPDNPMKKITSIGMTGENLSELTIDPKEITELFIISHRTNKDSFLRHLKEAFAFENIKIIKLNNVSDIEKQETGTLNIYTCTDEKSMLLREIKERLTITSKIIWYGKGFAQCSIFYDLNVTNKPLFMPSDAKEAYLLSEDEAIQFFPYGKESKT